MFFTIYGLITILLTYFLSLLFFFRNLKHLLLLILFIISHFSRFCSHSLLLLLYTAFWSSSHFKNLILAQYVGLFFQQENFIISHRGWFGFFWGKSNIDCADNVSFKLRKKISVLWFELISDRWTLWNLIGS